MSAAPANTPMPAVLGGLTPYLQVNGASKASEFYVRAFGGTEVFRVPEDAQGRTMHIHLYINGSSLMLTDPYEDCGYGPQQPQAFNLTLQVKDIDFWFNRAVEAGVTVLMPVQDMFWGARYCQLRDPFGVAWALNQLK